MSHPVFYHFTPFESLLMGGRNHLQQRVKQKQKFRGDLAVGGGKTGLLGLRHRVGRIAGVFFCSETALVLVKTFVCGL